MGGFLKARYAQAYHKPIKKIEGEILQAKDELYSLCAYCGKSLPRLYHFYVTSFYAAARLSGWLQTNQPTYDHLIPLYLGKDNEELDVSNVGIIPVRIKNREKKFNA